MAGKYTDVVKHLPKLPVELADEGNTWAMLIMKYKNAQEDRRPAALAAAYKTVRELKEELEKPLKEVNAQLEALQQLIAAAYEGEGISTIKLEGGGSVSTQVEPVSVVRDREAFRQWCLAHGLEKQMTLHASTADALVKELLLRGEPTPDGVEAFCRTKLVLRKK